MKKLIASALLVLFVHQLSAWSFYDQLCQFNFNWKKHTLRAPAGEAQHFYSDKEYVQAHLGCVLDILRSNPVHQLDAKQYASRLQLIELLDGYRIAGNFPINYYREERIPVFIDGHNTHCAVGYLLQQTGHEDMARRIAAADNYAWLKDIHDPEFPAWQEASGFTVEELKLVQGAYDFYRPDAFIAPDKYETPQKPACILAYFENKSTRLPMEAKKENIWCKGEGANGVLNGRWVQNYAVGMPWIVGYFENGQRSGQWQEYYQGTKQLCRTENWRNDKLNGVRKRFDRSGKLIEEILFRDGNAITKTNYNLQDSLTWVRKPLDSNRVWTQVYNFEGALIAAGHEIIHNPGNLLWFQNIELTALNSAAIHSRDAATSIQLHSAYGQPRFSPFRGISLYNTPPLVEYKKEGDWVYYKEYNYTRKKSSGSLQSLLLSNYRHFGQELFNSIRMFDDLALTSAYDSIRANYSENNIRSFYGYGALVYTHLQFEYYDFAGQNDLSSINVSMAWALNPSQANPAVIKSCGQYNQSNERVGVWKHYNASGQLYKTESYLIPWKEEDEL